MSKKKLYGELAILDDSGHTSVAFDEEVTTKAKEKFYEAIEKGYVAYGSYEDEKDNKVLHDFDPTAKKIVMSPRMVGG